MHEDLTAFVAHARERGLDFATIRSLLLAAGWKDKQVAEVFAAQALALPVPAPRGGGSPRETFLHLLAFAALATWVTALTGLLFTYLDVALPDPAEPGRAGASESVRSGIRWSIAYLVVSYPLFLVLWRHLRAEVRRDPARARSGIRRWLTYLSLFVGALTLVGDVVALLYYALEGELTPRFVLKVVTLFLTTGLVALYLALTLKSESEAAP